jgi:hypothetical protein
VAIEVVKFKKFNGKKIRMEFHLTALAALNVKRAQASYEHIHSIPPFCKAKRVHFNLADFKFYIKKELIRGDRGFFSNKNLNKNGNGVSLNGT